jgi:ABC-2 type transport system permease protein
VRKYLSVLWTDARQQTAYRGEFLLRGVMIAMFMFIFVWLWRALYAISGHGEIAGLRLSQVIWYLAMTETVILSGSRVFEEISEAVKSGDLAYALVRPYSYLGFEMAHSLGGSLPRMALNLVTATAVVLALVQRVETTVPGALGFLVLAVGGLVLDAAIAVLIGLGAFYIEEVRPLHWVYSKLLMSVGGMFVPLDMFPRWLQQVSAWLPFRLIIYAPARTFVAFEAGFFLRALAGQALYLLALVGILWSVWRQGQRRLVTHGG